MKIVLLIASLFTLINSLVNKEVNSYNLFNIECNYTIEQSNEVSNGLYSLNKRQLDYEIKYNNSRIQLVDSLDIKYFFIDDQLFVFYLNDSCYLVVQKYKKGILYNTIVVDNIFIKGFDVINDRNKFIFVSNVNKIENELILNAYNQKQYLKEINGVCILIDSDLNINNVCLYGGLLNDYFENIYYDSYNELVYIKGYKEQESGYDFGMGGNGKYGYFLLLLNDDLSINNYILFDYNIINVEFCNNTIVYLDNCIFTLSGDLNVISTLKFTPGCVFGLYMFDYYYAIFYRNKLKIYDYRLNEVVGQYEYEFSNNVKDISCDGNYIILKDDINVYKGVFYDNWCEDFTFIYDNNELNYVSKKEIVGIPNNYKLKNIEYEENYNPSCFGIYEIILNYEYFIIKAKVEVLQRCNIKEGYLYPVGYNISFSGIAYLNGEEVYNNHCLDQEGSYTLKVVGKDQSYEINFEVKYMDIKFQNEDLFYCDYELVKNQSLNLDFKVNHNVSKVIVNGNEYPFTMDEENLLLTIKFSEEEVGLKSYCIEKFVFLIENQEIAVDFYYYFVINVIDNKMIVNSNCYNNEDYFIFENLLTNNNDIRAIKVVSKNKSVLLPIIGQNINFGNYFSGDENLSFYFVYNVNSEYYEEIEIFTIQYNFVNDDDFGYIEICKNNDGIYNIILKINNNKNLKEIKMNNEIKYQFIDKTNYSFLIFSVVIVVCLFVGKVIYNKKRK